MTESVLQKEIADRLKEYIKFNFKDSPALFARRIRQSYAVVNRVLLGLQLPGGRLVRAMAEHTNVDLNWLMCGVARPMNTVELDEVVSFRLVKEKQMGMPGSDSPRLYIPYPGKGSRTIYAYQVQEDDDITTWGSNNFQVGDCLLMETNPEFYAKKKDFTGLFLVAVRPNTSPIIAVVTCRDGKWFVLPNPTPADDAVCRWEIGIITGGGNKPSVVINQAEQKVIPVHSGEEIPVPRNRLYAYCVSMWRDIAGLQIKRS